MERSVEFEVAPEVVWEAVTDPAQLADWLGDEVDIDVVPGGEGRVLDDGETRHVLVDEVDPGRRLTFTWWPDTDRGDRSYVEIEVFPSTRGSRLVIHETRLSAADARQTTDPVRWDLHVTVLQIRCSHLAPARV